MLKTLGSEKIEELNYINKKILEISQTFSTLEIANAIMTKCKPFKIFYHMLNYILLMSNF